jgi:ribonuclease BN (tRNA processing enzyme)
VAGVRVTPYQLNHPILTFGYRLEEAGVRFVFATDNELGFGIPMPNAAEAELAGASRRAITEWCRDADLLVHDAQYSAHEYRHHRGWGHSSFDYALLVARQAAARQLAFFHHDPMHSDHEVEAMVEDALGSEAHRAHRGLIAFPAAEGQELVL